MRQKKRCPLAEDILKNFPGDSVFLYPNLGLKRRFESYPSSASSIVLDDVINR